MVNLKHYILNKPWFPEHFLQLSTVQWDTKEHFFLSLLWWSLLTLNKSVPEPFLYSSFCWKLCSGGSCVVGVLEGVAFCTGSTRQINLLIKRAATIYLLSLHSHIQYLMQAFVNHLSEAPQERGTNSIFNLSWILKNTGFPLVWAFFSPGGILKIEIAENILAKKFILHTQHIKRLTLKYNWKH